MKSFSRDQVILGKGLAASILLHGVMFGLLVYAHQNDSSSAQIEALTQPRKYLLVSTEQRRPARIQPDEKIEATITEDLPPLSNTSPPTRQDALQELDQADPGITSTPPLTESASSNPEVQETRETAAVANQTTGVSSATGTLTPSSLRSAVTAYVQRQQGSYSEAWVSACTIYQKEHGVQDCPQQQPQDYSGHKDERVLVTRLMNSVNRTQRYARMTEQFMEENKELEKLMESSDPVLAELARARHSLNNEYVAYLNGNFNFKAWMFVQAANSSNGNLAYMSNFMQASCNPSPCVWEYTGFNVKKPQTSAEDSDAEFKSTTTVLGSNK